MTRRELLAIGPGMLLLNCASDAPRQAVVKQGVKQGAKPPQPVTGLHALYQMYTFARTWAQDLKVIRLSDMRIAEVKAVPGEAAAWQVLFSSEALGKTRTYTFSVYDESVTLRQGIFADAAGPLSGEIRSFVLGDVATDSDKAWEISLAHGQKYSNEHPDMPVSYILDGDPQNGAPVWRVIWGVSAATSSFSVLVDAHAGTYIKSLF